MKKKEVKTIEYVLESVDVLIIRQALEYCYHRLTKHNNSGIEKAGYKPEHIKRLLNEFKN